ncbi:16S rRNA (uracil(1498)-N(3))-methyltransferase [Oceanobacillus luteolus]|uniref:Ribosomal RNA small subunit methyltransferase E n=1 Tax=Oceanobacillus luteolus TaxID=1274358 RepID=A0ABW4HW33_9BACI
MQRYFILKDDAWSETDVTIYGEDVHHISRVMRGEVGDRIICNHRNGRAAICEISEISNDKVRANIVDWQDQDVELPIEVTIVQGLPKGDKMDFILQKGTELGADSFIPYKAERSIVVWDEKKMKKKLQRFGKIVKEASEQSHRNKIPTIHDLVSIKQLIEVSDQFDVKIFAYEEEAKTTSYQSFAEVLKEMNSGMQLLICIGPEGGFSEKEAELLKENDFKPVRFGPRILRTETAALYALSSISYHFEELRWNECKQ